MKYKYGDYSKETPQWKPGVTELTIARKTLRFTPVWIDGEWLYRIEDVPEGDEDEEVEDATP